MVEIVLQFEEFPGHTLTTLLFKDVTNCGDIRQLVVTGTLKPEAAILNAVLVPDIFTVHLAAHKALQAAQRQGLKTRSLHAEVVFNIAGSKHIGETLTRFGVNDGCKHLLVARFDAAADEVVQLRSLVQGEATPLSELPGLADTQLLNKYYKIAAEEMQVGSMGDAIACRMAARDC
ncbi:hypothetical protein N2152v2_001165 [Parachlorella kessleri]